MTYHRPTHLSDALKLLGHSDLRILAGGTDIYPTVNGRTLSGKILDITAIPELSGISETANEWHIGATTNWSQIVNTNLPPAFSALQQAAREVGSLQIQNSGTVAGNICNASPAADGVPPLLILDADVLIASERAQRRMPLAKFIKGVRETALNGDELVTGLAISKQSVTGHSAFEKLGARKYLVISICMVAARIEIEKNTIKSAAISVGSCGPFAACLGGLETALVGRNIQNLEIWEPVIKTEINTVLSAIGDIRGDAPYRNVAAYELVTRAISRAIKGGQG